MNSIRTIHRPIGQAVVSAWQNIFNEREQADKVIEKMSRAHREWGGRDRRQFAEFVYEGVRHWRRLLWAIGEEWQDGQDSTQALPLETEKGLKVLALLWRQQDPEKNNLPTWLSGLDVEAALVRYQDPPMRKVRDSIPDWLDAFGEKEMGEKWTEILAHLNETAPVFIRVNSLSAQRDAVLNQLQKLGAEPQVLPDNPAGLRLGKRIALFQTELFQSGAFEMQDGGSQQIAPFLQVEPGQVVVDACAGAGGKSLHLAALLGNRGKVLSLDIYDWKLEELKRRARRAGAHNIETKVIDSTKTIKRLQGRADRVLLDVPCSGAGVFRRNPDKKWKLTLEEITRLGVLQNEIIENYSSMLKVNGKLVYATCSIFPTENQAVVQAFLERHPDQWQLEEELSILPGAHGYDGFYAARMVRKS